ncbi:aromatic ring-hydroxylating oxygenase subunit alpha [Actomonas aquatica]|uniref:Aromatic ring-hydroxylating dioxygenase subunit alpha n=1 Tax=Actomonas aquatica TaxID=2866162 RepID=A0ABZ1CH19_9BACT|nr:aromatic ring-hydroxylating dioxygenase subunit alpha [Opitutus sp. WL0086]WRQ89565.1 aromatic ring-hydroxylating dioxygenase subunit alpha [Opitutus sp. WL0086]
MTFDEDSPFLALRRTWQPVALATDLAPGQVIGRTLLEQDLVLARFEDGRLLAADTACPHKGARLANGAIVEGELMCPYHGWRFDSAGACQSIPSLVEPNPQKCALSHLKAYGAQERYGMIWVKLDPTGDHELPDVPEFEDARWAYRLGPPMRFEAGFRREIENYLDMTHFAFAHGETLGKCADPRIPDMKITVHEDGFQMDAPFPALETSHEQPGKLQSAHHRRQRCHLPNFTTIRQTFTDGDERVLVHIPSPVTRDSCDVFWSLAISPGFDGPPPKSQIDFAIRVLDEDRIMCESQIPSEVPINPGRGGWGVLVTPGDTLANQFQKSFRQWLQRELSAAETTTTSSAT